MKTKKTKAEGKRSTTILLIAVFFLFLGIMDYPFLTRIYNGRVQGQAVTGYEAGALAMGEDEKSRSWEEARAYNQALAENNGRPYRTLSRVRARRKDSMTASWRRRTG